MLKQIASQADQKNPNVNYPDDATVKTALIAEIMKRIDSLESEELKLLNQLALHIKSTDNDEK